MTSLTLVPARGFALAVLVAMLIAPARPFSQGSSSAYAVYTAEGRRTLPFRSGGGQDLVALDQLAALFNLTLTEDTLVGGLTVRSRGETILLIPGQSFASIGPGRIVSLPAPVQRDRNAWIVPVEFIRQALGPALGVRVEIRRATHVILVGDVRLPQLTGRIEKQGENVRLVLEVEPPAPARISREGNRLAIRFDAVALTLAPLGNLPQEFVTAARVEGPALILTLGPKTAGYRVEGADPARITLDLLAPGEPPPPPPTPPAPAAETPPAPLALGTGGIRTIVIDPGHGGEDEGVKAGDVREKDLVLQLARRLEGAIESRMGLRVLLTRERDENVPLDRRASLANNNKADLFISLHANAAVHPDVRGAQVLSLRLDDYRQRIDVAETNQVPVPVVGGGTRTIDVVPWDVAQIPFAARSAVVSEVLLRHLRAEQVPLFGRPSAQLPLRPLVGANMPAVMLEIGFLSNAEEQKALATPAHGQKIIDAVLATIGELRRGIPEPPAAPPSAAPAAPAR